MRPSALAPLTLAMCALNLTGFLFIPKSDVPTPSLTIAFGMIMLVGYIVLWFFWQGHTWARWLVLLTSVVSVVNLVSIPSTTVIQRVVIIVHAALGAYLLFWLNTGLARVYVTRGSSARVA